MDDPSRVSSARYVLGVLSRLGLAADADNLDVRKLDVAMAQRFYDTRRTLCIESSVRAVRLHRLNRWWSRRCGLIGPRSLIRWHSEGFAPRGGLIPIPVHTIEIPDERQVIYDRVIIGTQLGVENAAGSGGAGNPVFDGRQPFLAAREFCANHGLNPYSPSKHERAFILQPKRSE